MKKTGTSAIYSHERALELFKVYRDHIFQCSHISCPDVFAHIVTLPASRFFVSEGRAAVVMHRISRGDKLENMLPLKRDMYFEIYLRYCDYILLHPDWNTERILAQVLRQPAPHFYVSANTARIEVAKVRQQIFSNGKVKV